MGDRLPVVVRRTYQEAWRRWITGERSPHWQGDELGVQVWMDTFKAAGEEDISPWDALLLTIRRRNERVKWVDRVILAKISEAEAEAKEDGVELTSPPEHILSWLDTSRKEEMLLARSSKMALDAGVAKALLDRRHLEGQVVVTALLAGIDSLELTPEERTRALTAAHEALSTGQGGPSPRAIDVPVDDDRD